MDGAASFARKLKKPRGAFGFAQYSFPEQVVFSVSLEPLPVDGGKKRKENLVGPTTWGIAQWFAFLLEPLTCKSLKMVYFARKILPFHEVYQEKINKNKLRAVLFSIASQPFFFWDDELLEEEKKDGQLAKEIELRILVAAAASERFCLKILRST